MVGNTYLEGTYSEVYPDISRDEAGLKKLFRQFSFPGGIPSHASPECPGSIHEGGELGYSLSHSFGAVFDNPELIVACVVGDGEAETGPLATAWHSNKFLDPATDGAVLPILHLNGYKIANPTVLARITHEELEQFLRGCGWTPIFVEGHEPAPMHALMAAALDRAVLEIQRIQRQARRARPDRAPALADDRARIRPRAGPGRRRSTACRSKATSVRIRCRCTRPTTPGTCSCWRTGCAATGPRSCSTSTARCCRRWPRWRRAGTRRMGANPHANGGLLLRDLHLPDYREYAAQVPAPGVPGIGDTRVLGPFLRDVARLNDAGRNFRVFGPDETVSNGLAARVRGDEPPVGRRHRAGRPVAGARRAG